MLVELLQPAGPDQVRRLAAALLLVPRDERENVVRAIEKRIVETYADSQVGGLTALARGDATLTHVAPPVQGPGYVEQVETEYDRPPHVASVDGKPMPGAAAKAAKRRAR